MNTSYQWSDIPMMYQPHHSMNTQISLPSYATMPPPLAILHHLPEDRDGPEETTTWWANRKISMILPLVSCSSCASNNSSCQK